MFEKSKERFMTEPDLDKKIRIETDMLDFAIEEVLLIKYEDEK